MAAGIEESAHNVHAPTAQLNEKRHIERHEPPSVHTSVVKKSVVTGHSLSKAYYSWEQTCWIWAYWGARRYFATANAPICLPMAVPTSVEVR